MATKFLIRIRVLKKKTDKIGNRRHRSLQRRLSDQNLGHCSELWDKIQEFVCISLNKTCRERNHGMYIKIW